MKRIMLITNESDITADFIIKKLKEKNTAFYRFNTNQLGSTLEICFDIEKGSYLIWDNVLKESVDLQHVKAVYYRRPELTVKGDNLSAGEMNFIHNELYYTLEGLYKILSNVFWVNKVENIRNAENKIYQLLLAKELGFIIPESIVTNHQKSALTFTEAKVNCIIKPIKSGLVMANNIEEGVIFTSKIYLNKENIHRIQSCPVYLQRQISKKGDVRVTIVGEKIYAALIHSQENLVSQTDWRKADHPLIHSPIELPIDIQNKCLALMNKLKLNFAAIDFVLDTDNHFIFLEINPNGQWAWIEKQLDYTISDSITNLLIENAF